MVKNVFRLLMMVVLAIAVAGMAVAQGGGAPAGAGGQGGGGGRGGGGGGRGGGGGGRGGGAPLAITSPSFADGSDIPAKFIGGMGVSPELNWTGPAGVASYVLIMHDLDAATVNTMGGDITHWVVWNIPGTATKLAENVAANATLPDGSHQANNIAGAPKYAGPQPPAGAPYHHYVFQLYGLNAMLDLPATATRGDIEKAMDGKITTRAGYVGKVKN